MTASHSAERTLQATAQRALDQFQRSGAVASDIPTAQRLSRNAGHARVERFVDQFVDTASAGGQATNHAVKGQRIRISSGPFEQMGARWQLAPGDRAMNATLLSAGRLFLSLWHHAGLTPIRAQNFGAERASRDSVGMFGTDRKCEAFKEYCGASDVLSRDQRIAVEAVVLHDCVPHLVGSRLSAHTDKGALKAVGMYALRGGLERLAVHFGMHDAKARTTVDQEIRAIVGQAA